MSDREFIESPLERGKDETFPFRFSVAAWPTGAYTNPTTRLVDEEGRTVSGALTGNSAIDGAIFTTPKFVASALLPGRSYRIECQWQVDGDVYEAFGILNITI